MNYMHALKALLFLKHTYSSHRDSVFVGGVLLDLIKSIDKNMNLKKTTFLNMSLRNFSLNLFFEHVFCDKFGEDNCCVLKTCCAG